MQCVKCKIREYSALFAVWHLGPEARYLPRVNLTVGPWKTHPKTVLRSRVVWDCHSMVRVIKEKPLLHYATGMLVLLAIICPLRQIENIKKQPRYEADRHCVF